MRFRKHYSLTKGEINLTPLVDVVFQLIIFFMLSSSFIMQPGIKIKLPKAETAEPIKQKEIFVDISEEGWIFFKGKKVNLSELEENLSKEIGKGDVVLIVKGDKNTKHGIVVSVLDIARKLGIEKIGVGVLPEF